MLGNGEERKKGIERKEKRNERRSRKKRWMFWKGEERKEGIERQEKKKERNVDCFERVKKGKKG